MDLVTLIRAKKGRFLVEKTHYIRFLWWTVNIVTNTEFWKIRLTPYALKVNTSKLFWAKRCTYDQKLFHNFHLLQVNFQIFEFRPQTSKKSLVYVGPRLHKRTLRNWIEKKVWIGIGASSGDLYPHCHKLKVVSGTWFSM